MQKFPVLMIRTAITGMEIMVMVVKLVIIIIMMIILKIIISIKITTLIKTNLTEIGNHNTTKI